MSELSNLIFHNAKHYMSSPYGKRKVLSTSAGNTSPFHNGVDYATYSVKLPQYAIEDGEVLSCGKDKNNANALFVWVKYPRLGIKLMHYHLDTIKVKAGQKVNSNTVIGNTGKTGRATGIHLHLGLKKLSGGDFIDPEAWFKNNYKKSETKKTTTTTTTKEESKTDSFLPERGYFKKGDVSPNIGKIAKFMYATFPAYTKKEALGNTYGENLIKAITEFQSRRKIEADGYIGKITLAELEKCGFKR